MTIHIFDVETTANGGPEKNSPEAHWPENRILMLATKEKGRESPEDFLRRIEPGDTLVAHNLKFDLKWLIRTARESYIEVPWNNIGYIDTMESHYINTGCQDKFTSMENLAAYCGLPVSKTLDLGKWLADGNKMEDIPEKDLEEYLLNDVRILSEICDVMSATSCDWIYSIALMELNGLPIDIDKLDGISSKYATIEHDSLKEAERFIKTYIDTSLLTPAQLRDFKWTAPRTLSFLLTGHPNTGTPGEMKVGTKVVTLNKGKPWLDDKEIEDIFGTTKPPSHLGFPMDEPILEKIRSTARHPMTTRYKLPGAILSFRQARKIVQTYCVPMSQHVAETKRTVHPKINITATNTGRFSSSGPNGQNMPEIIRECIEGLEDDEQIVEIDFKQLEVLSLAQNSRDPQLIDDLNNGVDLHYETGKSVFGWHDPSEMNESDRKSCKAVNFGLIYGGTEFGLSKSTGLSRDLVRKLINSFYSRYPGVEDWHKEFFNYVLDNSTVYDEDTNRFSCLVYMGPNLRINFVEKESPDWIKKRGAGRDYSYSPTVLKNYPVQGYAGRIIVPTFLENIQKRTNISKPILTVHDSVIYSTRAPDLLEEVAESAADDTTKTLKLVAPLKFDVYVGTHWK